MKNTITLLTLILIGLNGFSQTPTNAELKDLLKKEKYDKIIAASVNTSNYDAEALYYLGSAYYAKEENSKSIEYLNKSLEKNATNVDALMLVATIYAKERKNEQALEIFYKVLPLLSKDDQYHLSALYNTGMLEYQSGNYTKALNAYTELLKSYPDDYRTYAKTIQVYYALKQYDKAIPLKKKLYAASGKDLPKEMRDMFCFDQFKWKDKLIQAFERYENGPSDKIFQKHRFYVVNDKDDVEYRIQTEYSPVAVELGEATYILCKTQGDSHYSYNIGFRENLNYDALKAAVIKILENSIEPAASSKLTR